MKPLPLATITLLLLTAWTTWQAFKRRDLFERLMFRPERVLRGREYYRLGSSALLHTDWVHYFLNAITLVAFGESIELHPAPGFGIGLLLVVFVGAVIGGNLLALAMHRHDVNYAAVGASGGVCGVLFAHIFLFPGGKVSLLILPIFVPAWVGVLLFLAYTFSGIYRRKDNIGHDAHLGGALVGLAIATAIHPDRVLQSPRLLAAVVLLTIFFFWLLGRTSSGVPLTALWRRRSSASSGSRIPRGPSRHQEYEAASERVVLKNRLDELLDKVAHGGIHRLSTAERRELERLSQQLRK